MPYENLREEELKIRVAQNYFAEFDCAKIMGNIDFCVSLSESQSLLWAEAKKGKVDLEKSIVQLILTIGKARTFDKTLPPAFLGAFDSEKIAFIPYNSVQEIFYLNDFNWNVTPSKTETKEFGIVLEKVRETIAENSLLFFFGKDDQEIHFFIKNNFILGKSGTSKIQIDKNNFLIIYNKWFQTVKPTIAVNWDIAKKNGIIDADFYLADLLSRENESLKENLYVLLKKDYYELDRKIDESGLFIYSKTAFTDKQKAHQQFWNKYQRPPREEYWDYIIERRDLLVPQDVRERKGSFFTPQIWVELSQKYLADVLGEDWQDEYYIWDCAAGTGNLLAGLTNKHQIWASTLDRQDVDVMRDRIQNGANLLESHVFQFDFLNDPFEKLPLKLQEIIKSPEKRKKLVIYMNPPYAEATSAKTVTRTGKNKAGVSKIHQTNEHYKSKIGNASNELFALFMARIYDKIPLSKLALFSKIKFVQGTNFEKFREFFLAQFLGGFVVRADSFDNVIGDFPIGFTIWDTSQKEKIKEIVCDIMEDKAISTSKKTFYGNLPSSINKWIIQFQHKNGEGVGFMGICGPDFQNNKFLHISNLKGVRHVNYFSCSPNNLFYACVYFAVRHTIKASWINDRDQFLLPHETWKTDIEFQSDCLAYTLFHGQNRVSSKFGTNHWIPFTEKEIDAKEKFDSNFMTDFIKGKLKQTGNGTLLETEKQRNTPLEFSIEAKAVFEAGKELWKYYHAQPKINIDASLYDIREYFQGRNDKGKMNHSSQDEKYKELIGVLREKIQILASKIEPKVYEYGFLKS